MVNLSKTKCSSVFSVSIDVLSNVTIGAKISRGDQPKENPHPSGNSFASSFSDRKHHQQTLVIKESFISLCIDPEHKT